LDILTDRGHAPCTAFLVADNRLITNHHCVPGIIDNERLGATSILAVQFRLGYVRDGIEEGTEMFHVNPVPLETSADLDYSVLEIVGGDANARYGALDLSAVQPSDRDPFWVIGHPMGEAQRISREKCQADSPAIASGKLRHTCDTLPGNSGSPVIDAGLQQVVALHHAGSRAGAVNYAIPMADILRQSTLLKAAVSGGSAPPPRDTEELAALQRALEAARAAQEAAEAALRERDRQDAGTSPPVPGSGDDRAGLAPGDLGLRIEVAGSGATGTVVIDLFEDLAPGHAERIAGLARAGAYDGVVFHRVIDGFMAQTGDVQYGDITEKTFTIAQSGGGGSDLPDLEAEFSDVGFERGVVGMARAADPDSANSQFFIMFRNAPFLDGQYTAVGRVVQGMEIVDRIKRGDNASWATVGEPDRMRRVTVID
jgi:cyclophilin family peptidyl-prolyl cis-trans isomerase